LRIVVTDDDTRLLVILVKMLKDAGHCVFAAYDGLAACELAEYIPDLDLVITNTRLANLNAPDLIQRVRAAKPWLAVLHVGDPLPQTGPLADVPTLREPFSSGELLKAIDSLLELRQAGSTRPAHEHHHV
jgi:DNA-binding response OmpR family regulator